MTIKLNDDSVTGTALSPRLGIDINVGSLSVGVQASYTTTNNPLILAELTSAIPLLEPTITPARVSCASASRLESVFKSGTLNAVSPSIADALRFP